MALVILVVIVAAIAIWVVRNKKRTKQALELTMAVVGFETSGKTVFAGSMFHMLRVPDASGVFLDTTPETAGKLLTLFGTTADTDKKFPSSTNKGELVEWPFTVKVKSAAAVTDIGRFSYLDFAGESLRDLFSAAPNPETQRLYARFQSADIMMAVLDGLQIKRFLENRRKPAPAGPSNLLTWAKAMKVNLGLLQFDFSSFGSQTMTGPANPAQSAPVAIGQLIRFCVGKVGQLERDFPESDLVAFMYRQGL